MVWKRIERRSVSIMRIHGGGGGGIRQYPSPEWAKHVPPT